MIKLRFNLRRRIAAGRGKDHGLSKLANSFANCFKQQYPIVTFRRSFYLKQAHKLVASALVAGFVASACGASPGHSASSGSASRQASARIGNPVTDTSLPIHQRFSNLDEYLAHLERTQGPVDGPWYKQVSPGMYELQTGNLHLDVPGGEKKLFTREELEKKFGFSK
jgi:hypothetical protein